MEGTIIIKLYRNAISCGDYSDLNLEKFEQMKKNAAEFARSFGKRLLFTVCQALDICDFDMFCEIVTDADLTSEEENFYKKMTEEYFCDGKIEKGELTELRICPPVIVYSAKNMRLL